MPRNPAADDTVLGWPATRAHPPRSDRQPRLAVMTYNCSGMTAELYDVLCDWLQHRCTADIVVLQETHWGLGREDATWRIPGWSFVVTADPASRYSGVAILVSQKVASAEAITFCSWLPGRILHVKCECAHATLDVVGIYQFVWQEAAKTVTVSKRDAFWVTLSRLVAGIPSRNLFVLAGDFNGPVEHLPCHVGRGVLHSRRKPDAELLQLLQSHNLVMLNTWSRVSSKTATFVHDTVRTQIDFIAVRKVAADARARAAQTSALNLAPWRFGPHHRPVLASIPWLAGWRLQQIRSSVRTDNQHAFSKQHLQDCIRKRGPVHTELSNQVLHAVQTTTTAEGLAVLNTKLMQICSTLFPPVRKTRTRPGQGDAVMNSISSMWQAYRIMKTKRSRGDFRSCFRAWSAFAHFARQHRQLRQNSRAARRAWLTQQIREASEAAHRQDLGEVYRIIRLIAPKSRRDHVRIRDPNGHLLSVPQQFEAVRSYFATAFSRREELLHTPCGDVLQIRTEEVADAISALKSRKAVPPGSPVAEIWQLHPLEFAAFFVDVYKHTRLNLQALPSQMTHCSLSLLPKPNKVSRLPQDLRPLGLQDPASKVLAHSLKVRVLKIGQPWLERHPQYAYCPNRSLDEAVARAAQHCTQIRDLLQQSTVTVHNRRAGQRPARCAGGVMLSVDLSRAFDQVPRDSLAEALQHAGVDAPLVDLILEVHESCVYSVRLGTQSGTFPLQTGVRQGCALSPLLFSIYTCWLSDLIDQQLAPDWCQQHQTAFADDNFFGWVIGCEADLAAMCWHIQVVFQVLTEHGMQINHLKSCMVVKLCGSVAKGWLKKHAARQADCNILKLGTPAHPICIPRSDSLIYLGVKISYRRFELQTCKHRLKAARNVRQRLIKVLHTAGLTVRTRLRLYVACTRSSMLFGLHAVGFTPAVMRLLEATDAA